MKKCINILYIAIFVLLTCVASGCTEQSETTDKPTESPSAKPTEKVEEVISYDDYVITEVQNIASESSNDYEIEGVVPCKLMDVIMDGAEVTALEIRFEDGTREIYNLNDIEGKVRSHVNSFDETIVDVDFYSGGKAIYTVGEDMNLFVDSEDYYTFDSSKSINADTKIYSGEVVGFEFLPLTEKKKSLVIEHIIVELDGKRQVQVPLGDSRVESINSKGDIYVNYEGSINSKHIFSVNVDDEFGMVVNYKDGGSDIYSIGKKVELEKVGTLYKIANNYDNKIYSAKVEDFVLRNNNGVIEGIEEIVFSTEETGDIRMTVMDTGCDYAIPFGNILREYDSMEKGDDILLDVVPASDFGLELYYNERARVKISFDKDVKIFRDFYGKWHVDAY